MLASYEQLKVGDIFHHYPHPKYGQFYIVTKIEHNIKYARCFNKIDSWEPLISNGDGSHIYIFSLQEAMTMLGLTKVPQIWYDYNTPKIEWEEVV